MNDIGHNQPDELTARVQDVLETAQKWIDERPEIADEDTAKKLQTFLMQINAAKTTLDDQRKDLRAPFAGEVHRIDADWNGRIRGLSEIKEALEPRLRAYMLANGLTSIKGDLSPRASGLRVTWRVEILDPCEAIKWVCNDPRVIEAMQKAIVSRHVAGEIVPAVKWHKEHKVV